MYCVITLHEKTVTSTSTGRTEQPSGKKESSLGPSDDKKGKNGIKCAIIIG